jgi:GDP-L-fucose synthase
MDKNAKIYIAGHLGMVGSAIMRNLKAKGFHHFVTRSLDELNLLVEADVARFFEEEKPDYVVLAAAKVGGIVANNTYRAQFIYENLMIQNHVIHQSYLHGVKKLLFLGSSCIYPRLANQPISEDELLTGVLEPTNEPYAIAKIAGIKMCEAYHSQYGCNFISIMPTNLYGQNDNYDLEKSHVLPALIRKMLLGKYLQNNDMSSVRMDLALLPVEGVNGTETDEVILSMLKKYGISKSSNEVSVTLWGTGTPKREFLHVDDMADASVFLLLNYDAPDTIPSHVNAGCGEDVAISELAAMVKEITGFEGSIVWDTDKPDGTPRKLLDVSKLKGMGWSPSVSLESGIQRVVVNYLNR